MRTNWDGAAVGSRPGAVAEPLGQSRGFVVLHGQRGWNIHARIRLVRGGVLSRAHRRDLVVEARGRAATTGRGHRGGAGEPVERHGAHARGGSGRISGRDEQIQQWHQALDAEHHQARQRVRPVLRESHRKRGLRQGTRGAGRSGGGRVRVRPGRRRRRRSRRKARRRRRRFVIVRVLVHVIVHVTVHVIFHVSTDVRRGARHHARRRGRAGCAHVRRRGHAAARVVAGGRAAGGGCRLGHVRDARGRIVVVVVVRGCPRGSDGAALAPSVRVERVLEPPRAGPVAGVARDLRRRDARARWVEGVVVAVFGTTGRGRRGQAVDRRASLGLVAEPPVRGGDDDAMKAATGGGSAAMRTGIRGSPARVVREAAALE
mmetsp:Transcript_11965/g.54088  ORF Transcript_11965/g.54088 Transcript_11965/m.54088 type:complete len:374 (+) Transcript_11965:258-1379(+)